MSWHGFPANWAGGVLRLWQGQERILGWQGAVSANPVRVRTSAPQGDALSPWCMNFLLLTPTKVIGRSHPRTTQVTYVDDRSWASQGFREFRAVWNCWKRHTPMLGLVDNVSKSQFSHKTAQGRDRLRKQRDMRAYTSDNLLVLGSYLGRGGPQPKEKARIEQATRAANKLVCAPVGGARRHFVSTMAVTTKEGTDGLLGPRPTRRSGTLTAVCGRPGMANAWRPPPLVKLVLGHGLDIRFVAGCQAFSAAHRAVGGRGRALEDWHMPGGVGQRLRRFVGGLGWREVSPWVWSHPAVGRRLCLDPAKAG